MYPIYASYKALSSLGTQDDAQVGASSRILIAVCHQLAPSGDNYVDTQWLTYWIVYGVLTSLEAGVQTVFM